MQSEHKCKIGRKEWDQSRTLNLVLTLWWMLKFDKHMSDCLCWKKYDSESHSINAQNRTRGMSTFYFSFTIDNDCVCWHFFFFYNFFFLFWKVGCHTKRRMGVHGRAQPSFGMTPDFSKKKKKIVKKKKKFLSPIKIWKVCVIPKEGWVRPREPILLLVWQRLGTLWTFLHNAAHVSFVW